MDDLISRVELFDELNRRGVPYNAEVNMVINGMPSAQTEIIRCNSCRHDNNCAIQDIAQTGGKFFCGFAQQKGEEDG